ncbi:MAG: hypothetical protein A2Z04_09325 [Chloroflexi bacterium RBG_16_57_9]|nr:MAG: hypothetical protein A2Z04_09325 [Chloroflexi bacterium RBG_16_57_9]
MQDILKLGFVGFAISLGVLVTYRMSTEAMAVVVGVVFGVVASIPGSLLVLAVLRRQVNSPSQENTQTHQPRNVYPQVVVVQPGTHLPQQSHQMATWPTYPQPVALPQPDRAFTIIGDED